MTISEYKRQEELFRQVVEMAPNAMVMIDNNGTIEMVNTQAEKIFGYARAELLGQSIEILLPTRYREQHPHHRGTFFTDPTPRSMGSGRDLFAMRKNGSEFPVEVGLNPITTADGDVKILSAIVDISERKRAEQILWENNERFRMILESMKDYAITMLDTAGYVVNWNSGAERIKGYREDEILGQHFSKFYLQEEVTQGAPQTELEIAAAKGRFENECWRVRKDGSLFFANHIITAIRDREGKLCGFSNVTRDISEKKQAEIRQLQLIEELTRINEELNNFSYIASHDLKSPLRGIDQLASWIAEDLKDKLDDETRDHLRLMRNRIYRMETLLDDLLAYSRVGRSSDEITTVDVNNLIRDVFELTDTTKKIHLRVVDDLPTLHTYKVPLELIFRNLVGNAVKHHDKQEVYVTVSAKILSNTIEFSVTDDGPGIDPKYHQRVFGMFQTLKPRDIVEGSGIGLALVKKAVESVGGKVTLESNGHTGCTFRFTWPIESP